MARKEILRLGTHGRSVRVFVETFANPRRQDLVRVQWRENGKLHTQSLPNSRENQRVAKDYAGGVVERLRLRGPDRPTRLTIRELGERYAKAHPVPDVWRAKTLKTWKARWKVAVAFLTPERHADTVEMTTLDDFRSALRAQDYAINQVANHVQMLKTMFAFARERNLIAENKIAGYRMRLSRDARKLRLPEWTPDECRKILAALDPEHGRQWRAFVAIALDAVLGGRSNALLKLEWRDVDLEARTVRWRPELDKLAKDRVQPLPDDAVGALRIALVWREHMKYRGPFVLPGARGAKQRAEQAYTYQALNYALREAAKRAKVEWVPYRAMHGFRRMVVGNVEKATGSITRAGQWIGDTDLGTLSDSYMRTRPEELRDVAGLLSLPKEPRQRNQVVTGSEPESGK